MVVEVVVVVVTVVVVDVVLVDVVVVLVVVVVVDVAVVDVVTVVEVVLVVLVEVVVDDTVVDVVVVVDEVVLVVEVVVEEDVVVVVVRVVPVVAHPQRKLPFTTVAVNGALSASATTTLESTRSTCSPGVQAGGPSVSVMTATGPEPAGIVPPPRLTTRALIRLVAPTWFAVQVKPAVRSVQAAPAPEASWSSSGLSSSENVRPRTAMGLSSEIGTWMPAAPGSPQTSDPVSTTRSGVVDVVVDVLVVVDGPLLVVDDEVVVVVSGAVEVVEEDEVVVVVVEEELMVVEDVVLVVVLDVVLEVVVDDAVVGVTVVVVDEIVLVVLLLVVVDVLVVVELVVAEQGRFAGRGRQRSVTLSKSAVGMAPRPTASTRSDCRPGRSGPKGPKCVATATGTTAPHEGFPRSRPSVNPAKRRGATWRRRRPSRGALQIGIAASTWFTQRRTLNSQNPLPQTPSVSHGSPSTHSTRGGREFGTAVMPSNSE